MNRPDIPCYSDSENSCFHPVFHHVLDEILKRRNYTDFRVEKQRQTPVGPVDLVLARKSTGRVVLPIEIKKTKSGVRGCGRRQARDYQQNLATSSETAFYCVSNLELTELFKNEPQRKTTLSQQIKLTAPQNATLGSGHDDKIIPMLRKVIEEILDIVIEKKQYAFVAGLSGLETKLKEVETDKTAWHRSLLPFCFEYIRGVPDLTNKTKGWKPAMAYKSNPKRLIDLGRAINFEKIFSAPESDGRDFVGTTLVDAFAAGKSFSDGDDVSSMIEDILFKPQEGIVETDADLANLLAVLARNSAGELSANDVVVDPGAGSGKLLSALIKFAYPEINPLNVLGIEKEQNFREALSLRLGLQFGKSVSKSHSPNILISPVEAVPRSAFDNVKVAVVNPPFVSAVNASEAKKPFEERICDLTGRPSILGPGQIGLEALFIELLYHLLPNGATIAFIYPYQVISRLSPEYARVRRFMLERLGLTQIVTYPMDRVFEKVVKRTAIFVAEKGMRRKSIQHIDIQIPVADLDLTALNARLNGDNKDCYGVTVSDIPSAELIDSAKSGWKRRIGIGKLVDEFLSQCATKKTTLEQYVPRMYRGVMGNSGNTGLTVQRPGANPFHIPKSWIVGAVNNARDLPKFISRANAPDQSFIPPASAYEDGADANLDLIRSVREYLISSGRNGSTKRQKTAKPNVASVLKGLRANQRKSAKNAILLPRACREEAKLGIVGEDEVLVSTNLMVLPVADVENRDLLASWLQSVFGQLQLEMFSSAQEGMRKLEMNGMKQVYVPDLMSIPKDVKSRLVALLKTEDFLRLDDVQARESDKLWATVVIPNDARLALSKGVALLREAYDDRTL